MVTNGLALAAHFGDGVLRPADVAAGIVGAVVKDPVSDRVVWQRVPRDRGPRARRTGATSTGPAARPPCDRHAARHPPPRARLGPGGAAALAELRPDVVLIEGPPEADELVALAARGRWSRRWRCSPTRPGEPPGRRSGRSRCSPRSGRRSATRLDAGVPVRFCDLPGRQHQLRRARLADDRARADRGRARCAIDPLGWLADGGGLRRRRALVGRRHRAPPRRRADPFAAIAEAMTALRARAPCPPEREAATEARREAYMRTVLRRRSSDGARADRGGLRRLARAGAGRAAAAAGGRRPALLQGPAEGQGRAAPGCRGRTGGWPPGPATAPASTSPGWYHHLFTAPDQVRSRAGSPTVAGVLRARGPAVSPRARHRGGPAGRGAGRPARPAARRARRGHRGDPGGALRRRRRCRSTWSHAQLVVGERLGSVPDETPDGAARSATCAASSGGCGCRPRRWTRDLDLDLRKPNDLERSQPAAPAAAARRRTGASRAAGGARQGHVPRDRGGSHWQPEFAVDADRGERLGHHGRRPPRPPASRDAVGRRARPRRRSPPARAVPARRPRRRAAAVHRGARRPRPALDADVDAPDGGAARRWPASLRYGDVRGTDAGALAAVVDGLVARVCVGLPGACTALDDEAAARLLERLDGVHAAITPAGRRRAARPRGWARWPRSPTATTCTACRRAG